MYCTKLLHHTYTKIRTLSCRGIVEHHGIFLEKKHTTVYKSCLSPPAVTFCLHFLFFSSQKQTRVRFDSALKSPVPQRHEGSRGGEPSTLPSPPSRSASSGKEPPVKQKAEQSCAQAPPQRPLVPLVSMILEQQSRAEGAQVKDTLLFGFAVSFICVLLRRMLTANTLKRVNIEEGKTKTRNQNNSDIFKTVCISPQQYKADWRLFEQRWIIHTSVRSRCWKTGAACNVLFWSLWLKPAVLLGSRETISEPNGIQEVQIFKVDPYLHGC